MRQLKTVSQEEASLISLQSDLEPLPPSIPHTELAKTTIRKDWLEHILLSTGKSLQLDSSSIAFFISEGADMDSGDTLFLFELLPSEAAYKIVSKRLRPCMGLELKDLRVLSWKGDVGDIRTLWMRARDLEQAMRRMFRSAHFKGEGQQQLLGEVLVLGAIGHLCQAVLIGETMKSDEGRRRRVALHMSKALWRLLGVAESRENAVREFWSDAITALRDSRST